MTATDKLAARIETPRMVRLWGNESDATPVFVRRKFGNGGQLISISPANDRPEFYVVRIDSRTDINAKTDRLHDLIDDVLDAIREQCGDADDEDRPDWPALDISSGFTWDPYSIEKEEISL